MFKGACTFLVAVSSVFSPLCFSSHSHSALSTKPIFSRAVHEKLNSYSSLIRAKRWARLEEELRKSCRNHDISLDHLVFLAAAHPLTPFHYAVHATKGILDLKSSTGLTLDIVLPITLFVETSMQKEISQGKTYWPEARYGREIEYDTEGKKVFIHLGTHGVSAIGEGRKKIVTKTILYHRIKPEVFARGYTTSDIEEEIAAMKALKGLPGLLQPEAFLQHPDPKTHLLGASIITKIFRPGSLHEFLKSHARELTLHEQIKIASDISSGLASMHTHGYVHRDLGARNYFINISGDKPGDRKIQCVIADMGRTVPYKNIKDVPVQGNSTYLPPEGVFRARMQGADYCASDLFAVGCVLWHVCFGKPHPWGRLREYRDQGGSKEHRFGVQQSVIRKLQAPRLVPLIKKTSQGKNLSLRQRFERLVLKMTNPVPEKRGKAEFYQVQFRRLLREIEATK
jgi:serine/threonine protein kinase